MYILFSGGGDNIYKGVLQSGGWYQPPQKMLWEEFTESHHCKILLFFNFLIHFHFLFSHSEPVAKVDEAWVILYIVSISYSFIKLLLRQQVYVEPSKGWMKLFKGRGLWMTRFVVKLEFHLIKWVSNLLKAYKRGGGWYRKISLKKH